MGEALASDKPGIGVVLAWSSMAMHLVYAGRMPEVKPEVWTRHLLAAFEIFGSAIDFGLGGAYATTVDETRTPPAATP